jgi:hypothetical protein
LGLLPFQLLGVLSLSLGEPFPLGYHCDVADDLLPIELVDGVCDQLSDGMVFIGAEAAAPVSPAKKPACAPGALYLDSSEVVAWARNGEAGLLLETGFDSAHRWTVTRWPGGPGRSRAQWSRARRASSSA